MSDPKIGAVDGDKLIAWLNITTTGPRRDLWAEIEVLRQYILEGEFSLPSSPSPKSDSLQQLSAYVDVPTITTNTTQPVTDIPGIAPPREGKL